MIPKAHLRGLTTERVDTPVLEGLSEVTSRTVAQERRIRAIVPDTERLGVLNRRQRSCKFLYGMGTSKKGKNMNYYALCYDVVDHFVSRRSPYRDHHLRLAQEAYRRGELLLAGALSEPVDRALLVFHVPERTVVEDFARNDPYVTNGLVTRWEVRLWTVVIGNEPAEERPRAL
jgi:uncharacterized protein